MRTVTIKGLIAKRGRLALTAIAIVLGVAFLSAAGVMSTTIKDGAKEMFAETDGRTDLEVRGVRSFADDTSDEPAREPLADMVLDEVRRVPGVSAASGSVHGYAEIADEDGSTVASISTKSIGGSADGIGTVSPFVVRTGRAPAGPGEVAIDAATADERQISVGERVSIRFAGPAEDFTVVGTVGFGDLPGVAGTTFALFDLETAQRVLGRDGQLDEILVGAARDVTPAALADRIQDSVSSDVEVITTAERSGERAAAAARSLSIVDNGLTAFALIALAVAGFLIVNTFTIVVAQRTRELALLRALGASSRQVRLSVITEALATGFLASFAGTAVGVGLAAGLRALVEVSGVDLPGSGIVVGAGNLVAPLVIGTALATFAAYVPARKASRLSPMAAVRDVEHSSRTTRARYVAGGVLLLFGLVLNVLGVPLLLIGAALLAPLAIAPLAGVIGRASARVGGLPAQLGHQNAARNPRRTASTASALMIGLALVVGLTITADSALSTFGDALDSAVTADFIVDSEQTHLSPEVSERLAAVPELSAVSPMRFGEFELVDAPNRKGAEPLTGVQSTSAVVPETIGDVSDLGYSEGALDRLRRGGVLVSTKFSEKYGWRAGDVLSMRFARTGVQPITIAGTYEEDTLEDQGFVMSMREFAPNFTDQLDIRILLAAADDVKLDDAKAAIEEVIAAFPNARVQTNEEYAAGFADRLDIALAIVAVILGLAVLIAVLGVVNTLALSMVERIRELGLLRAVGMTRAQMRAMVRWEAITIGVIGGVLGIVAGIPVGSSLAGVLGADGVTFPWLRLLLFLVFAVLAGVVASVLPARRAAHLDVLAALDHE